MAGIRNKHAAPPRQKEAILLEDLNAMLETLDRGSLRGIATGRCYCSGSPAACAVRKSPASISAVTRRRMGAAGSRFSTRARWYAARENGLARGGDRTRLVGCDLPGRSAGNLDKIRQACQRSLFRRVTGKGKDVEPDRLNDQEVARLVKKAALAAGVRGDLSEDERAQKFAGHSLRAGLASSAEVDERHVQNSATPRPK
jgi:hypothetical protein